MALLVEGAMSDDPAGEHTADGGPAETVWEEFLEDASATAEQYRAEGWETYLLSLGDVALLSGGDRPDGLDVLLPNAEFDLVDKLQERTTFDSSDVYARTVGEKVFLLLVELASEVETAVVIPAYYDRANSEELLAAAAEGDGMCVHLRSLGSDHRVTFTHEDHTLFAPE
jgi:hypothetical protein